MCYSGVISEIRFEVFVSVDAKSQNCCAIILKFLMLMLEKNNKDYVVHVTVFTGLFFSF